MIVASVHSQRSIIVPAIHQENTQRLLFAFENDVGIRISSTNIGEASDVAEHLTELIRALPRYCERGNGARTRSADAMPLRVSRNVVVLVKHRQQFVHDDARVLVIEGVVLSRPVGVAIAPIAPDRLRLIGAAARIDENADHNGNLAAVDQAVHHHLRSNIALRGHESLPIVVNHQAGRSGRVVLRRHVDPIGMLSARIGNARKREWAANLAFRHSLLHQRIRRERVMDIRIGSLWRGAAPLPAPLASWSPEGRSARNSRL